MSHQHHCIKCKVCGIIVSQCRCADKNKTVRLVVCTECELKGKE